MSIKPDTAQIGNTFDVDQAAGTRQTHLEKQDKLASAGKDLGLLSVLA